MDSHLKASLLSSPSDFEDYEPTYEHRRFITSPYLASHYGDDCDFYYGAKFRGYRNRQLYLHSYKFTRERSFSEQLKTCVSNFKFKAAAWAAMACNYKPVLAGKIKKTLNSTKHCLKCGVLLALPFPKARLCC